MNPPGTESILKFPWHFGSAACDDRVFVAPGSKTCSVEGSLKYDVGRTWSSTARDFDNASLLHGHDVIHVHA